MRGLGDRSLHSRLGCKHPLDLGAYLELIKPRITLAIFLLFLLSMIAGAGRDMGTLLEGAETFSKLVMGGVAVVASVAGSNALNNYLDRDIDARMARTRRRAIPSGRVKGRNALWLGMILLGISIPFTRWINDLATLFLALGVSSYILAYTTLLKRRSAWNVFATAPAIASPLWIGWILGRGELDTLGFSLGLLMILWGPFHLWSLSTAFAEDYRRAGIPMLPTVIDRSNTNRSILALSTAMILYTYLLSLGGLGVIYPLAITPINIIMLMLCFRIRGSSEGRAYWRIYKFSAPYILHILLMITLARLLA